MAQREYLGGKFAIERVVYMVYYANCPCSMKGKTYWTMPNMVLNLLNKRWLIKIIEITG